ncbi:MAG: Gfo/Idh/MocA family oxidoreductase, partial [Trueperaceae bacterium]
PYRAGAGGWKSDPAKVGSSILEEPIHYLDLARWYLAPHLGEPTKVHAWATGREDALAAWENLDVRLDFGDGRALVTRSIAAWGHQVRLHLVGTAGALQAVWRGDMDLDPHPLQALVVKRGHHTDAEAVQVPVAPSGHAFDLPRQTQTFMQAVAGQATSLASAADGRAAVALCLAVERALHAGADA